MWIPIAIIALGLLAWAVLSGMPFGGEPDRAPRVREPVDVVEEAPPPATTATRVAPSAAVIPPLRVETAPPLRIEPASPREPESEGTLTEPQAIATLRNYITGRDDYGVSSSCLVITSQGYKNRGYTLEAHDRCGDDSVGRWRVDTLTGRVYRQRADGRYLDP